MGIDCSNCKCTNREEEKMLIIEKAENKIMSKNVDNRKNKLENVSVSKAEKSQSRIIELLKSTPGLPSKIVKLQSLIRKYRDKKLYMAIIKQVNVLL